MMNPILPLLLSLLLSFTVQTAGGDEVPDIQEAPPGGDFTLRSADGPISLQDYRGKLVFLYFGYAKCPDVCPTALAFLTQALNELNDEELRQVQPIFVSVDPKRDTPELLKEYVEYFHPAYVGLTGTEDAVSAAAKLYGTQYYQVELEGSAFGYSVNHSAVTYLIDHEGSLRFVFPHGTPYTVLLEAARHLLAQR